MRRTTRLIAQQFIGHCLYERWLSIYFVRFQLFLANCHKPLWTLCDSHQRIMNFKQSAESWQKAFYFTKKTNGIVAVKPTPRLESTAIYKGAALKHWPEIRLFMLTPKLPYKPSMRNFTLTLSRREKSWDKSESRLKKSRHFFYRLSTFEALICFYNCKSKAYKPLKTKTPMSLAKQYLWPVHYGTKI